MLKKDLLHIGYATLRGRNNQNRYGLINAQAQTDIIRSVAAGNYDIVDALSRVYLPYSIALSSLFFKVIKRL